MSKSKIGTVEAIFIVLTIVISHSVLSLPRNLISQTKSATIINIVFLTAIAIGFAFLIYKLMKNFAGSDIIDISEYLGGKTLKNIIGIIFITHFIVCSSILLRNFCESLQLVYFQMTDIIFILLLFIIAMCIANSLGFNVTLKANLIILPAALISIIIIFVTNFKNFDPQKIFPILGDGVYNTFVLGLLNLVSFGGIIALYFIPPHLKEPQKLKIIAITSMLITGIYILLCVAILLFIFPAFTSINEVMPLYSAARYISFGTFIQRLESIFLFVWLITILSFLCISCKFSVGIFQKMTSTKDLKPITNIFGLLILGISLLPKSLSFITFFENNIYMYLTLAISFALGIGILIIANIKKKLEIKKLTNTKEKC